MQYIVLWPGYRGILTGLKWQPDRAKVTIWPGQVTIWPQFLPELPLVNVLKASDQANLKLQLIEELEFERRSRDSFWNFHYHRLLITNGTQPLPEPVCLYPDVVQPGESEELN